MAEIKFDPTMNSIVGFDIINSSPDAKVAGYRRFQQALPELLDQPLPTSALLFRIHDLITPDVTLENLPENIKNDMAISLMTLDRPDADHVGDVAHQVFNRLSHQKPYDTKAPLLFGEAKKQIASELQLSTKISLAPVLKGGLRTFGAREINGYPPEPVVYASHTLVMGGEAQMLALQFGQPGMIYPDSYYGLSTGLNEVYTKLCDKYDSIQPASTQLSDIFFREAYFQVLGTRLLHPFWDGNGRAFTGQLFVSLSKQGITGVDLQKLQETSIALGYVSDRMVKQVLKSANLSLVSDLHGIPGTLLMWLNPRVRADYMKRLKAELERAIDISNLPDNEYFEIVESGKKELEESFKN